MMNGRTVFRLLCLAACALPLRAMADSAYEQAVRAAGPGYVPPSVPEPTMKCETCTTRTPASRTGPSSPTPPRSAAPRYGLPPAATVGGAILGPFLGSILSPPDETASAPDPAAQAREQAARRAAEEETRRRAAEAEERHRTLLSSLKGLDTTPAGSAATPVGGLQLKSPAALETLRSRASAGWDTAALQPDVRLDIRFRALPLATGNYRPHPVPVCTAKSCRWPQNAAVRLPPAKAGAPKWIVPDSNTLAALLAAAANRPDAPARAMALAWEERRGAERLIGQYVLTEEVRDTTEKLGATVRELLWVWGVSAAEDAFGTPVKALEYVNDVLELAQTTLDDAGKAANWLGSDALEDVPELTPLAESARPFALYGAPELESAMQIGELGKRLLAIWRDEAP